MFWTNKKFVFFFDCLCLKKFVDRIGEANWWKHLMNLLFTYFYHCYNNKSWSFYDKACQFFSKTFFWKEIWFFQVYYLQDTTIFWNEIKFDYVIMTKRKTCIYYSISSIIILSKQDAISINYEWLNISHLLTKGQDISKANWPKP